MYWVRLLLCSFSLLFWSVSFADQSYLERYQQYQQWRDNLPIDPSPAFLSFISQDKPLSKKLYRLWLYHLGDEKAWDLFLQHYRIGNDAELQCDYARALYDKGEVSRALELAKPLWLTGHSQNKACDPLFSKLLHRGLLTNTLIEQRIVLALRVRNLPLARYLLKQLSPERKQDIATLIQIYRRPDLVKALDKSSLHDEFYLYGLKRMVSRDMDKALRYYRRAKQQNFLNHDQQQAFLAHVALYKAMRNHADAYYWFNKVDASHYNEPLLEWQIRFALKNAQWSRVQSLIAQMPEQKDPGLIYWRGRALEKMGDTAAAKKEYEKLSKLRHYYGFLANTRLQQPLAFEEETPTENVDILSVYQPVLDEIEEHYQEKRYLSASRMINDFSSELPKNEQSAVAAWAANTLHWYGKSVYLSNEPELRDQLDLRFPLAHQHTINKEIKRNPLPEALVFAIIRQESAFRDRVVSPVGAHGLMQIMPKTAKMVARKHKIPYRSPTELFQPRKNIKLGVAYLTQLSKRFNGHPALMAAAYNAGPHSVVRWMRNKPAKDVDIWIETIPFHETRNYLKNVMAFYAVYLHRLNKPAKLQYFMRPVDW